MKWLKKRHKDKRLCERAADKHKDYMRPVRIMERIQLRIAEAGERQDMHRINILMSRARKVRDFQIAEWGH